MLSKHITAVVTHIQCIVTARHYQFIQLTTNANSCVFISDNKRLLFDNAYIVTKLIIPLIVAQLRLHIWTYYEYNIIKCYIMHEQL